METVRLNLVLPAKSHHQLSLAAIEAGCTKSEYIRRALSLASFVQDYKELHPKHKLSITDENDKPIKELIIFS